MAVDVISLSLIGGLELLPPEVSCSFWHFS
jgi:hypothetical protein